MPSSAQPASAGKRGGGGGGGAGQRAPSAVSLALWLVLGGASLVLFATWMFMHHTVSSEHKSEHEVLTSSRTMATEQQLQQVQRLYDDTRGLLTTVMSGTSNASHAAALILQHSLERMGGARAGSTASADAAQIALLKHQSEAQQQQIASLQKSLVEERQRREKLESAEFGAGKAAVQVAAGAAGQTALESKWLVIGIPSVPRANEEDYLLHTLEALARQLPRDPSDLLYQRVAVMVVNVHEAGKPHRRFAEARALYAPGAHPLSSYFYFSELSPEEHLADPKPGATAQNDLGNANVPGYRVRKQTRNVAAVMRRAYTSFPDSAAAGTGAAAVGRYYLFLEDDMLLCRHGLVAIQYLLAKASRYHPNWLAIRASYGMNGIFMHMADVPVFAAYLFRHQLRRPPDHLVVEWFAGETPEAKAHRGARANVGFRHNIFDHIGTLSSLRTEAQTSFPRCYELLVEPTVFQVEAFSPKQCPRDDIWPCQGVMGGVADSQRLGLEGLGPTAA